MVRAQRGRFQEASRYIDRFGLLLLVSVAAVVTLSLVDLRGDLNNLRSEIGTVTVSVFVGATLLLALRASGVAPRYVRVADVFVGLGVVGTLILVLVQALGDQDSTSALASSPSVVWIILSVTAPVAVIRRLLTHRRADRQTLMGAVSAYLLLAMAFDFVFLTLNAYQNGPFFGGDEPTTSFMYFSLATISTLGYGDLAAVRPAGRMLSTFEAVIGQVYLVTFVAMIVGLIVGQRQGNVSADPGDTPSSDGIDRRTGPRDGRGPG